MIVYYIKCLYINSLAGDWTDNESCVDELMDYHGHTTVNRCIDWSTIFQPISSSSAFWRDVFDPSNFHSSWDDLDTLGSQCR